MPSSAGEQATGLAPPQAPASQVSVCVQALPALHGAPLVFFLMIRRPPGSTLLPSTTLFRAAVHTRGLAPTQAPASQVSVCVQALPSLHGAPLGLAGLLQTPGSGERRVGEECRSRGVPYH